MYGRLFGLVSHVLEDAGDPNTNSGVTSIMKPNFVGTMDLTQIHRNLKQLGTAKTIEDVALKTLNQVFFFRILEGLKIEKVDPEFLNCHEKYRSLFLTEAMLMGFADRPEYELSRRFLDEALGKGDECYGILHGDVLAAYGWYSRKPTEINAPGLMLHFDDQYIYMYKGFTHADHRGQRLHAIGMTRALEAYLGQGYKGILSYVESNNFGSLKSCYRMGYTNFGHLYVARLFGQYLVHSDVGCRRYGFELKWARRGALENQAAAA